MTNLDFSLDAIITMVTSWVVYILACFLAAAVFATLLWLVIDAISSYLGGDSSPPPPPQPKQQQQQQKRPQHHHYQNNNIFLWAFDSLLDYLLEMGEWLLFQRPLWSASMVWVWYLIFSKYGTENMSILLQQEMWMELSVLLACTAMVSAGMELVIHKVCQVVIQKIQAAVQEIRNCIQNIKDAIRSFCQDILQEIQDCIHDIQITLRWARRQIWNGVCYMLLFPVWHGPKAILNLLLELSCYVADALWDWVKREVMGYDPTREPVNVNPQTKQQQQQEQPKQMQQQQQQPKQMQQQPPKQTQQQQHKQTQQTKQQPPKHKLQQNQQQQPKQVQQQPKQPKQVQQQQKPSKQVQQQQPKRVQQQYPQQKQPQQVHPQQKQPQQIHRQRQQPQQVHPQQQKQPQQVVQQQRQQQLSGRASSGNVEIAFYCNYYTSVYDSNNYTIHVQACNVTISFLSSSSSSSPR